MSTEHQRYSPQNQSEAIAKYASPRHIEIVRTYADHGRSGLNISGRRGLRTLLDDVNGHRNDFSLLLVYDVSRWGRFQDADESAYYEYVLKKAGVHVHYCAEPFVNDGSLTSAVVKTIKRAMAGEFSRELSVKTFAGQSRLVELGFRLGGPAGYALRRQLVDEHGNPKGLLAPRQHKSIHTDRIILVPGPESEIAVVTNIYENFIALGKTETRIAADLNAQGVTTDFGRPWTRASIHQILINPKYIGANVFNRRSFKLRGKKVPNPPAMWIRSERAFEPIVSSGNFQKAQAIIHHRLVYWTDKEMLDGLRGLLESCGRLSAPLIDTARFMPSSSAYARRFGGLLRAYSLVGWCCPHRFNFVEGKLRLKEHQGALVASIVVEIRNTGAAVRRSVKSGHYIVNEEFSLSIRMAQCHQKSHGHQWIMRFGRSQRADISLVVRLDGGNETILDYYVFPSSQLLKRAIRFTQYNPVALDAYRFDNLDFLLGLCKKTTIGGHSETGRN